MGILTDPDALPQLIGEYRPADRWQAHINTLFYGLKGGRLRDFYQTFASADYRLAHALAADYYARVKERDRAQAPGVRRQALGEEGEGSSQSLAPSAQRPPLVIQEGSPSQSLAPSAQRPPLVIHEWGCGNGNLAACFLSHLQALDTEGLVYPRLRYVLVDNHQATLDAASAHPGLAAHRERVDTLCADVTQLDAVQDGTVDRILCNELWSDLPAKLTLRTGGEIEEEYLRPNLKEHRYAAISDWSAFVNAFDEANIEALETFQPFLEEIVWEKEYRKVEWKDVPFRKTITEFLKQIEEQVLVPVNVGAALTIKEAKRVLASGAIGFSSFDAGASSLEILNDPDKPCHGQVGGQYSFIVNFLLMEAVARYLGIPKVEIEPQREFVGRSLGARVASLTDLLATHAGAGSMSPWEQDLLIVKTIGALNERYQSPYPRKLDFPVNPQTPAAAREGLQAAVLSLKEGGVPDTVSYLTEPEIQGSLEALEQLGYDGHAIPAALAVPPQGVDYTHLFLSLG